LRYEKPNPKIVNIHNTDSIEIKYKGDLKSNKIQRIIKRIDAKIRLTNFNLAILFQNSIPIATKKNPKKNANNPNQNPCFVNK
jgi:hypothetical protein